MGIILDILIIIIFILSIYMGYKKGLINVGFSLVAFVASILAAIVLYSPITHLIINNTQIDEGIANVIIEKCTQKNSENTETSDNYIKNYTNNLIKDAQNATIETTARTIAINVIGICVMIALFTVIRIVLMLLSSITNIIARLPIVKQLNEVGGILYGILRALLIVYVILAIAFFVVSVNANGTIYNAIESSYVAKFFYNNNIILNVLF